MNRILSRRWLLSLIVTLAALGLLWALDAATAAPPARPAAAPPDPTVRSTISYQGRLLVGGVPDNGLRNMIFQLYGDSGCNVLLGAPISKPSVNVSDGYFGVQLDVDAALFEGRAIWIGVQVGDIVLPCQEILPAPYALGLRPGAQIQGPISGTPPGETFGVLTAGLNGDYASGSALWGYTTGTGTAVRGESPNGYGVFGYTENGYAVYGRDWGTDNAYGYGGYFESTNGVGAYGYSIAIPAHPNIYAPGLYGKSNWGVGVYGANEPSVVADPQSTAATGAGVLGTSRLGFGVEGYSKRSYAVYGNNQGDTQGKGYGGCFTSNTGVGAYGYSSATPSHPNIYAPGVYGKSLNGVGVYGSNEPLGTVADPQISASTGTGVLGTSRLGFGVEGYSKRSYAVYGNNFGDVQGQGYGGYFTSNTGVGAYGYSSATPSHPNTYAPGVYGKSLNGAGVYGLSQGNGQYAYGGYFRSENYRGLYARGATNQYDAYFGGNQGIYVVGSIWAGGSKAGYVVDVALNDGPEPLKLGDVVVISGVSDPVLGSIPAPRVRKASTAGSTAVMGVVARSHGRDP